MFRIALLLTLVSAPALADTPKQFELDGNTLKVGSPVVFDTGKATLKAESKDAIAYVAAYLEAKSYISTLRVEVHSDATGAEKFNQKLTEARALAVAKAIVAMGADCKRLLPVGFGSTKPVADNKTPEGKAQNRRTVFANAALRGHAIGGMPVDGGGVVAGDPCK
jgi:OOP family OmpA-OmpF porin